MAHPEMEAGGEAAAAAPTHEDLCTPQDCACEFRTHTRFGEYEHLQTADDDLADDEHTTD